MSWTVEGRGDEFAIVDNMGVEVASVPYTGETGVEPLDTAEGRRAVLLASAPCLLAALEAILDDVQGYGLAHPEGGRFECDHNDAARAAIARAQAWQAEEEEPSKPESPWLGLAYITAIVCACIIGLLALPYMIIFFSGCWRGC